VSTIGGSVPGRLALPTNFQSWDDYGVFRTQEILHGEKTRKQGLESATISKMLRVPLERARGYLAVLREQGVAEVRQNRWYPIRD